MLIYDNVSDSYIPSTIIDLENSIPIAIEAESKFHEID